MENRPLVSVLIPTFNVGAFVEEAISSILSQTYTNLELIIVDDCSTDNTFQLLEAMAKEDTRIKLFKNDKNLKIVKTLNFAFSQSNGHYIARMDGDDVSLPTRIEKQLEFLINNPDVALVGLNIVVVDELGNEVRRERFLMSDDAIKVASKYVTPVPHFWLARRSLYYNVGLYRIATAEDLDFLLRGIDAGYKFANIRDFLYLYRVRSGNTATAMGLVQHKAINYARKLHKERLELRSLTDSFSDNGLKKALKSSIVEEFLYKVSSYFRFKYLQAKSGNVLKHFTLRVLSILFSPKHQITHLYRRFKYRNLIKIEDRILKSKLKN